jgi:hypothetical protein
VVGVPAHLCKTVLLFRLEFLTDEDEEAERAANFTKLKSNQEA